ncbi:MAG TPA: FadR family transcriptional regulator [Polyangiaceae bacterium]|nr:FadR family transcriptional regulator [Polyangiaceae bacterium]
MFAPIAPRESAVEACAEQLRQAILGGTLKPGDKLPPERKLAGSFGVNRMTLRSALGQLARARLVEVRQGSGYAVRDFRQQGGPDLLPGLVDVARSSERAAIVDDLLRVRRHLARAVLEKLVTMEPDLDAVRDAIDDFGATVDDGVAAVAEADLAVVRALLAATGSPVLQLCTNPIERAVREMDWLADAIYAEPEGNLAGWRALLAWLERGDPAGIDDLMAILEIRDEATVAHVAGRSSVRPTKGRRR